MSTEASCSHPRTCPSCRGELEYLLHRDFRLKTHGSLTAVFDVTLLTCRKCAEFFPLAEDDEFMARAAKEWFAGYAVKEFGALVDAIRKAHNIRDLDVAHLLDVTRHHLSKVRGGKVAPSLQLLRFARFVAHDPAHARTILEEMGISSAFPKRSVVSNLHNRSWARTGPALAGSAQAAAWSSTTVHPTAVCKTPRPSADAPLLALEDAV